MAGVGIGSKRWLKSSGCDERALGNEAGAVMAMNRACACAAMELRSYQGAWWRRLGAPSMGGWNAVAPEWTWVTRIRSAGLFMHSA